MIRRSLVPIIRSTAGINRLTTHFQTRMLLTISQSLDEAYKKHKIISDVVDKFVTQGLLTIEYDQENKVSLGNTLAVDQTQKIPLIQYTLNSPHQDGAVETIGQDDRFILVLTDPDAPSNSDPKWSQYLHWLITDLKIVEHDADTNSDTINHILDFSKGQEIIPYMGPGPPANTGKHRYVFLLYKQDPDAKLSPPSDRPNWGTGIPRYGVRDWITKYGKNSKLLSVNFFYAQNEQNEHSDK